MGKKRIRINEVKWLSKHHLDSLGATFQFDNRLFTLIYKESEQSFRNDLIHLWDDLESQGFVLPINVEIWM